MKKYLKTIAILLLLVNCAGCNVKHEVVTKAIEKIPGSTTMHQVKLNPKTERAEYLQMNALQISSNDETITNSNITSTCSISQINGLKSKDIQNKINDAIKRDVKDVIKSYSEKSDETIQFYGSFSEFNYNNLISISINSYDFNLIGGLVYNIADGNRIYLKDLFTEGTDYVSLLNRKIIEKILSGSEEESELLREPFSSISPDQNFALSFSNLKIIFHRGEAGFVRDYYIDIPIWEIDDYMDILDRQIPDVSQFEKPYNAIRKNNIYANNISDVVNTSRGSLVINYIEIRGMKDKVIEDSINSLIKGKVDEALNYVKLQEEKSQDPLEMYRSIEINVTLNCYDYLSLTMYSNLGEPVNFFNRDSEYPDMPAIYTFDLKSGKQVDFMDMLNDYSSKNPDFKLGFTEVVKNELRVQFSTEGLNPDSLSEIYDRLDNTIDYSFIINNSMIYIQGPFNYPEEPWVYVSFKRGPISEFLRTASFRFYENLKIMPEDFFKH